MKTLLRIDCSSRIEGSYSRMLSRFFEQKWREANPNGRVIHRDLLKDNIPHIDISTIQGFNTPKDQMPKDLIEATKMSDVLIKELKSADDILISSPLYNLNIPSNLKAYIDQIVRVGETLNIDKKGSHGLLSNIQAYLITVKGGVMKGTSFEEFDFQEPYLKAMLNYVGIKVQGLFSLEGTAHENLVDKNTREVENTIAKYFNNKN